MAEQPKQSPPERREFDGSRWVNYRPSAEEIAEWFETAVGIDPALNREDYLGGVVLIPAVDTKAKYVVGFREGKPVIDTREEFSHNPYARVETRIKYWWDLLAVHPEWMGVVEPVELPRIPVDQATSEEHEETTDADGRVTTIDRSKVQPGGLATMTSQLPSGFSVTSIPVKDGYTHFLCSTIRVSIYLRADVEGLVEKIVASARALDDNPLKLALSMCVPLRTGRGTKQVPFLTGYRDNPWADPNLLMKTETGALGRALGFAGIFCLSGSGVATAEDVTEALAQGAPPVDAAGDGNAGPSAPAAPPVRTGAEQAVEDDAALHKRANALWKALSQHQPAAAELFGAWAKERKLHNLSTAQGAALRGAVRKLEKLTDEAAQAAPPTGGPSLANRPPAKGEEGSNGVSSGATE